MTHDYTLAEKMKNRFGDRGASISGMRATSTDELMRLAKMGGDPRVNCSEQAFRDELNKKRTGAGSAYSMYSENVHGYSAYSIRGGTSDAKRTAENRSAEAKHGRSRSDGYAYDSRRESGTKNGTEAKVKNVYKSREAMREEKISAPTERKETKSEKRRLSPVFALVLVIGTVMIMSVVIGFSKIYQTVNEISVLEAELQVLRERAAELELELEEKNDVRTIEKIATEKLGMVSEDSVRREYVSVSEGEHVKLIENSEDQSNSDTAGGMLLSSIASSFDNLFDYFR